MPDEFPHIPRRTDLSTLTPPITADPASARLPMLTRVAEPPGQAARLRFSISTVPGVGKRPVTFYADLAQN